MVTTATRGALRMAWTYLVMASALEILWAMSLKHSDGFRRIGPSAVSLAAALASFYCLALAVRVLPLGTAYAVWTGIGATGVAAVGIVKFGEPAAPGRLFWLALVVVGIVGLRVTAR
jgi:quaternary ammonium compound-resistance protein SugE